MGLNRNTIDFIHANVTSIINGFSGKRLLELGDQLISDEKKEIKERTGKEYYQKQGVEHTSIDMNGKNGAIKVDLSHKNEKPEWANYFDIMTNAGTTEHVEPFATQYECFKSIHEWIAPGGIMIHMTPGVELLESKGAWKNHCNNYYSEKFFRELAAHNDYTVHNYQHIDDLIFTCLQKNSNRPFMTDQALFLKQISRREGGIVYLNINDQELSDIQRYSQRIFYVIKQFIRRKILKRKV